MQVDITKLTGVVQGNLGISSTCINHLISRLDEAEGEIIMLPELALPPELILVLDKWP